MKKYDTLIPGKIPIPNLGEIEIGKTEVVEVSKIKILQENISETDTSEESVVNEIEIFDKEAKKDLVPKLKPISKKTREDILSSFIETTNERITNLERISRENARSIIAFILLGLAFVTIVLSFFYIWSDKTKEEGHFDKAKDFITLLWTNQISLLGSALGFYFGNPINQTKGSKEKDKKPSEE